jgi:chemotaxis protein MotB
MGRIPEDVPVSAPDWIVTFSDMVSLLVTFFILLMTFSSLDSHESFLVRGNLRGTRGILTNPGGASAPEPPQEDVMTAMHAARGSVVPHSRPPEGLPDDLEEMGQRLSQEHIEVDLTDVADGLLIHFDPRAGFAPGSAQVNELLASALAELGRTLQHYPHLVLVEGHTDAAFEPSPAHPEPEDLALARAQAAARVLLARSELPRTLVQVAGIGSSRPSADNSSPQGRAVNRRVEVRVLSLSRARHADLTGGGR